MQDFQSIGHTKKLYGIKGGLKVSIEEAYFEIFLKSEVLFLDIEGRKIPFFLQQIIESPPLRVRFEDHLDRDAALPLTGKEIFLPSNQVPATTAETIDLTTLAGFSIEDESFGPIGTIEEVQEFPQQLMAVVAYQEKTILIPLHENLIQQIEMDSQTVFVSLPEGLLDL